MLQEVDCRSLERFVYACYSKEVAKDQILFLHDEPSETVFVVRTGKIAITLSTPDGRELVINEMLPGDLFGDIAAVLGQPRSACAVAPETNEVIVTPYNDFIAMLARKPKHDPAIDKRIFPRFPSRGVERNVLYNKHSHLLSRLSPSTQAELRRKSIVVY